MNRYLSTILSAAVIVGSSPFARADDYPMEQYRAESRKTAQAFMQTLGATLKSQLQAGGPESAIRVCQQVAPALAHEYSIDGRTVKRVSLKPRNTALGTPDPWETQKLKAFEQRLAAGEDPQTLETSAVIEQRDGRWYRYMKAIPTQAMCLQCHGPSAEIPKNVKSLLASSYPDDRATGYRTGEIRGAFTIKQKLEH